MNELKSYTEYAVSTPTADFVIGFDFNYGEDAVNVTVDDVPATEAGYTVVYLNETTIRLSPSVPSGIVRLQRETDIDQTDHAYRAGAKFIAQTMDENFEQLRHSQQEVRDGFSKLSTDTHEIIEGLDAALALAQDAAQDAQDAALIAQGAADTVNTIIVGGKVGASNVLDSSGETQQQVNYNGGAKWHSRVGGYLKNERVVLDNGDIVKSTVDGNANNPNVDMTGWVKTNSAGQIFDASGLSQQEWNNGVESIMDLLAIPNPKNGSRVFVKSIQNWYTYNTNLATPENGVTIVGKWVMDIPEKYFASWFATKNVQVSQSPHLRLAHEVATKNNRPLVIDGNYYVMPDLVNAWESHKSVINVLDNSDIEFAHDGCITVLSNSFDGYYVLCCFRTKNFNIINPRIIGDLDSHTGTTGEWGYGIAIFEAKDGYIPNARLSKLWGDGFYIGKPYGSDSTDVPTNITITDPIIDRTRRNGISFTAGDNVKIMRPVIKNVYGTAPEAGIDIEPEELSGKPMSRITNSIVDSPTFLNNARNIWVSWYGADRHIDLNFTGITKIVGGNFPLTFYSYSALLSDKQTGVVNFQCIDFTCTTANKIFETELSLEDRGAVVNIEKLIIRNAERWQTHFARFGTQDIAIAGLKVNNIQSETLKYATFTTIMVNGNKQTINPRLTLGFEPSVLVLTDPDTVGQIKYGLSKIGGYSLRDSTSSGSSYNYPSNNIIVKPFPDAYLSLNADYRKLKVSIDARDESIERTLYINDVSVELISGTVKGGITLQGKGGFVEVQKYPTGRGAIYNAYGNIS